MDTHLKDGWTVFHQVVIDEKFRTISFGKLLYDKICRPCLSRPDVSPAHGHSGHSRWPQRAALPTRAAGDHRLSVFSVPFATRVDDYFLVWSCTALRITVVAWMHRQRAARGSKEGAWPRGLIFLSAPLFMFVSRAPLEAGGLAADGAAALKRRRLPLPGRGFRGIAKTQMGSAGGATRPAAKQSFFKAFTLGMKKKREDSASRPCQQYFWHVALALLG